MRLLARLTAIATLCCALQVLSVLSTSFSKRGPKFVQVTPKIAFALNEDVMDWKEAYQVCKNWSATLAFPASAFEGEMLRDFLINTVENTTKDIHLGFHSLFAKGIYTTMEGRDMDDFGYWQWDPQSENGTEQRCGALTVDGMKTIDCDTRQESICEFQESLYYDEIEGFGFYRFHDLTWNWTDAISTCKIEGSNLLTLRSTEEYDAIFNFYSEQGFINGSHDVLYGAHRVFGDDFFLDLADEPIEDSGYNVWASGEPGDLPAADFPLVGLHLTNLTTPDEDAGLFVLPWGSPLQFICKRELH